MSANDREVEEGLQHQGADEAITYSVNVSAVAVAPATCLIKIYDATAPSTNLGAAHLGNTTTLSGSTISFKVARLVAGNRYQVKVLFNTAGNTYGGIVRIQGDW